MPSCLWENAAAKSSLSLTTQYDLQLIPKCWEAQGTETTLTTNFNCLLLSSCYIANMCFRRSHQLLPSFTVHLFTHLCSSSLKTQPHIQQAFPISFQSTFHIWRQRAVNPFSVLFPSLLFQWEDRKWWTSNQKDSQNLTGWQALKYSVPFPILCIFILS